MSGYSASNLLRLAGAAGLGTAGQLISSAISNYTSRVPRLDTRPPVSDMARPVRSYRSRGRRYRRRAYRPMLRTLTQQMPLMRTSGLFTQYIGVGLTTAFNIVKPTLDFVKNSDLVVAFDLFRIRKVQVVVTPVFDPGNSGITNNDQLSFICACDPSATAAPANYLDVGAYGNHKSTMLTAGKQWTYTFYPKVTNIISDGSVAQSVGSYGANPWIQLTAAGTNVQHFSLLTGLASSRAPTVATTVGVQYYFRVFFDVKNMS